VLMLYLMLALPFGAIAAWAAWQTIVILQK